MKFKDIIKDLAFKIEQEEGTMKWLGMIPTKDEIWQKNFIKAENRLQLLKELLEEYTM